MTITNKVPALDESLFEFATQNSEINSELLEEFILRYPENADLLRELALDLALDTVHDHLANESNEYSEAVSPMVARAISHFQNCIFEVDKNNSSSATANDSNPIAALDQRSFSEFADNIGSTVLALKLRERAIIPETIPRGVVAYISNKLGIPENLFMAHMHALPCFQASQHFKAQDKPSIRKQETFEEAIKGSYLSKEKEIFLLSL